MRSNHKTKTYNEAKYEKNIEERDAGSANGLQVTGTTKQDALGRQEKQVSSRQVQGECAH